MLRPCFAHASAMVRQWFARCPRSFFLQKSMKSYDLCIPPAQFYRTDNFCESLQKNKVSRRPWVESTVKVVAFEFKALLWTNCITKRNGNPCWLTSGTLFSNDNLRKSMEPLQNPMETNDNLWHLLPNPNPVESTVLSNQINLKVQTFNSNQVQGMYFQIKSS